LGELLGITERQGILVPSSHSFPFHLGFQDKKAASLPAPPLGISSNLKTEVPAEWLNGRKRPPLALSHFQKLLSAFCAAPRENALSLKFRSAG
jgi:hypothetical protein